MEVLKRVVVGVFFVLSFCLMARAVFLGLFPDLTSYYFGPQHVLMGENPYREDSKYFTPLVYPPLVMVLFTPLAIMPYELAGKVWVLLSIMTLVLSLYLLSKLEEVRFFSLKNLFICSLVFIAFPVRFTLGMGQINHLILFLFVLSLYFLQRNKKILSGIILSLSLMIKFFPVPFLFFLFWKKEWRILLATLVSIGILFVITVIFLSPQVVYHYFMEVLPTLLSSWKSDYYNQSLSGVIARSVTDYESRALYRIVLSLVLGGVGIVALLYHKGKDLSHLAIGSLVILSVLINSFSWQHHFVLLIPSFYFLVFFNKNVNKILHYSILTLSYFLLSSNIKDPGAWPIIFQSHVFFGGLLLYAYTIYLLLLRKDNKIRGRKNKKA